MNYFRLTNENIYDLSQVANCINSFRKNLNTLKALLKGREVLFKNMHNEYPNMSLSAITSRLWEQECSFASDIEYNLQNIRMGLANFGEIGVIPDRHDIITNVISLLKEEGVDVCKFSSLTF